VIVIKENVKYWLEIAEYDIITAKAMLTSGRFLYVGFMCHQTIEKALKAVIARDCAEGEIPPKTHHLLRLVERAGIYDLLTADQIDF